MGFVDAFWGAYGVDNLKQEQQEQERALLDLDSLTVLLESDQTDPFQDVMEGSMDTEEEEIPVVGPDEWLED